MRELQWKAGLQLILISWFLTGLSTTTIKAQGAPQLTSFKFADDNHVTSQKAWTTYEQGLDKHRQGKDLEASDALKQAVILSPRFPEAYNTLCVVYDALGRHDEAIAMYQHFVQLAPAEPNAHDSLGIGYQWAGRYGEAIQEYERALTIKPDFEISLAHVANTLFQQGGFREAIEKYQRYVQIAPSAVERSRGYTSIAHIQLQKGSLVEAEQSARQATANLKLNADGQFLITLAKGDLPQPPGRWRSCKSSTL